MPSRPNPAQTRGARGLLDWTTDDLARAAGVSVSTAERVETAGRRPISDEICAAVGTALERAGAQAPDDEGGGAGLRLDG